MAVFTGRRLYENNVAGTTTNNPLTNVGTTLNSAGLANLPAVASNHAVIILDPGRAAGAPEIVIVTAHTAAATSATITRGAYGTTARQHASGTTWVHAYTKDDVIEILTADPTDVYEGAFWYRSDTDRLMMHNGSIVIPVSNVPRAGASRVTTQSVTNSAWNLVTFTVEDIDTDAMFSTGSGDRFTCVTPGRYMACFNASFASNATGLRGYAMAKGVVPGTGFFVESLLSVATAGGHVCAVAGEVVLAAGETVSCQVFQNSGGALNLVPGGAGTSEPLRATVRWVAPT